MPDSSQQSDAALGQPLAWRPAAMPGAVELEGRYARLRPPSLDDAEALFAASEGAEIWTYLPYGPFASVEEMCARVDEMIASGDPHYFTICTRPELRPAGVASYMRMAPEHGSIEIGHIWFGHRLQRTAAATEAIFLLMAHAFDELGYRRVEWKCDALNARSRRAAERFGFRFEGVFRQHMVVKGRNRDTAWFALTDGEWPEVRRAFEDWLDPANFDAAGRQRKPLLVTRPEAGA